MAAELAQLASLGGHILYVHPAVRDDLAHDLDPDRRQTRGVLLNKYPQLPDPPRVTANLESILGRAERSSNDWVDNQLLAAVAADAVDVLVTEDRGIRAKAKRIDLSPRVCTVPETLSLLRGLFDASPRPPPAVLPVKAHALNPVDPIFESFRRDYPGFDKWLAKCRREHRSCWVIDGGAGSLAAFTIIKHEQIPEFGLQGKLLKICSFKPESTEGRPWGQPLKKPSGAPLNLG